MFLYLAWRAFVWQVQDMSALLQEQMRLSDASQEVEQADSAPCLCC